MTINPDIIPLAWVGCLIVVGTKDRRTIFRMENGGYSPILRPYACIAFIAWMKYVIMTIKSDIISLAGAWLFDYGRDEGSEDNLSDGKWWLFSDPSSLRL